MNRLGKRPEAPTADPSSSLEAIDPVAALQRAADSLSLALTDAQIQQLTAYLALLQRWNAVYNLTALRNPADMLSHHLVDCLAALPALRRHAGDKALRVLDVGSGGGLPGVVLAIAQPAWTISCVDTVAKKASFIRQVAAELGLPGLLAVHARVESLAPPTGGGYDVITSRAFASLKDFTSLTHALLAEDGVWMAMKARLTPEEQTELPSSVKMFHVEQLTVPGLDAQRCLVWMRPTNT